MLVKELLLKTLEDLLRADFEKFKWYLNMSIVDGCKPIPNSKLEEANQQRTVNVMIESYREAPAVNLTVEILRKMNMNNAAEELQKTYAEENTAATSTSSSASAPPTAPATISAQHGAVVIAPNITGSRTGSVNITINKS